MVGMIAVTPSSRCGRREPEVTDVLFVRIEPTGLAPSVGLDGRGRLGCNASKLRRHADEHVGARPLVRAIEPFHPGFDVRVA